MTAANTGKRRRAVITGASSGIGLAIAKQLIDDDWSVVCLSRTRPAFDDPALDFIPVDLLERTAFEAVLRRLGAVDAIVHSAGVLNVGQHTELDLEAGDRMWQLHLSCAAQLVKELVPQMPDGGRIVLIGSRVAAGVAERSMYAASKAALIGFARSVAAELTKRRITVNVIAPGATDTPMLRDPARASVPPKLPPFGQFVKPEEVAALAGFLLSDGAANLTGQNIVVCAGASL